MSLAFCVSPASNFIYDCLCNGGGFHPKTGFWKNFGFIYNNNFLRASGLRYVRRQKLRLLKSNQVHRLCKFRDGFNSDAPSYSAASSFNNNVGEYKDCRRIKSIKKKDANGYGPDANTGYGHGNGNTRGNYRGGGGNGGTGKGDSRDGGDNSGTGSNGLVAFAHLGGVIGFCWRIYKTWTYYFKSANHSSSKVELWESGKNPVKTKKCPKKMADRDQEGLRRAMEPLLVTLYGDMFAEMFGPCMLIAAAICATLLAGASLVGGVVALVIWIWRPLWS